LILLLFVSFIVVSFSYSTNKAQASGPSDAASDVNNNSSLATTNGILQTDWMATGLPGGVSGVLCADINKDGKNEVIMAGSGGVVALNGSSGKVLWRFRDAYMGDHCQPEIADVNNDGKLEIVAAEQIPTGTLMGTPSFLWGQPTLQRA
jgi:hypothetical protein